MFPPRQLPGLKLADVHSDLAQRDSAEAVMCQASDLKVYLADTEAVIGFPLQGKRGPAKEHRVPANSSSLVEVGNLVGVPTPFLKRQDNDIKGMLLNALLEKMGTTLVEVRFNDDNGIVEIGDPNKKSINPQHVVEVAARVLGEDASVIEWWKVPGEFRLDACNTTAKARGKGGAVDDITLNGLRFGQNLKTNTAPWVQGYFNRKVCTNGYEVEDHAGRFDARGLDVEQVLAELEAAAQLVFSKGPERIKAFYDLQNETVENPERTVLRLATEQGMAPRFITPMLAEHLPPLVDPDTGMMTMFDVVNLITNQALNPSLVNKDGSRRKLEQAGGHIICEHVERCRACQTRLN